MKSGDVKTKMPYKMFMGMRKKTLERLDKRASANREMDVIAETGGNKKQRLMESVFARRENNKRKEKQGAKRKREALFEKITRNERSKKQELMRSLKDPDGKRHDGPKKWGRK